MEGQGLEAAWRLPQEATPTAFGLAEMRSSTFTGEAPSLGSSAVPVGWTGAVWTLPYTATVMPTSHSGEGTGGQDFQDSKDSGEAGLSHCILFPQENGQGAADLCGPSACHADSGRGYEPFQF